ncbi:MAG: phosphopantothenoylcysteine decarboxylase [Sedimentisphaerales bacterium]|nr:phosphopantothenoylcysteine decarboxylase [Sedimentisphaerales bacterium]
MHFLITAGGTREYLDPVRFLSNASSGKMGYALARAALRMGHEVTLITAPTYLRPPKRARLIPVVSAADMFREVRNHLKTCDCLIMAAAVADYTPVKVSQTKIKKSRRIMAIRLTSTTDILAWAGRQKRHPFLVGFALEDKHLLARAQEKRINKNLDLIVANTTAALQADDSIVWIQGADGNWDLMRASKEAIARSIIRRVTQSVRSL